MNQIDLFQETHGLKTMTPIYRIKLIRESGLEYSKQRLTKAEDAYRLFMEQGLGDEAQEVLVCLFLTTKNTVIGLNEVSRGTLTASLFHPREILKGAILANAHGIIIGHNHPSGDPEPSNADKQVTSLLKQAATLVQIELLDHVVVGHDKWYSFRDSGLL
ncbi:MAG: DNA repair protein RadC [Chlorobiaceae bacterium]|nr:DNA repair protein RadC [Chlorobiaceae bacterium]